MNEMDAFEAKHWSKLQILLWICVRDKAAVRWSAHQPWMPGLAELDGYDGTYFESEQELIGLAIINLGGVMPFFEAERELTKALADGDLCLYTDPSGGQFSDRATVLKLWHAAAAAPIHAAANERRAREWLRAEVNGGEKRMSARTYQAEMVDRFGISARCAEKVWVAEAPPLWKQRGRPSKPKAS